MRLAQGDDKLHRQGIVIDRAWVFIRISPVFIQGMIRVTFLS